MMKRYAAILVGILFWTSTVSAEFVAGPAVRRTMGKTSVSSRGCGLCPAVIFTSPLLCEYLMIRNAK